MGFAERLKEAMKRKGVGVAQFAEQVPVEPNSVSRWRAGYVPGPVHLARVAALLDTTTGFLKDGEGIEFPAGTTAGHEEPMKPSGEFVKGSLKSESFSAHPDPDRPLQPQLPEPVFPDGTCASKTVYEVVKANLWRQLQEGQIDAEEYKERYFWANRQAVASAEDQARALTAQQPNGGHAAG